MTRSILDEDANHDVKVLCFNLKNFSRGWQFILLTAAVFVFHLIQGYMHELIFRLDGFKPYSLFLTLLQFGIYAFWAVLESFAKHGRIKRRKVGFKTYLLIAFLTVATLGLSNTAVAHLNFPTFNMFKSCKLIPVMIGSIIILGKRYNIYDTCAVLLMCVGLVFFTLADSKVRPDFQLYGVLIVCMALVADAVIGNVQEKAMNTHDSSNVEMVLYSYSIGFVYILIGELLTGELFSAIEFCSKYPKQTYGYIMIFSTVGYFGVNVVLTLVKHFGALLAVTVTTCRKAITIVLSFILFAKPFTFQYFWSGLVVVLGIYLNLYSKNKRSWDAFFNRILRIFVSICFKPKTLNTEYHRKNINYV